LVSIPQIQIRQQFARLGIEADIGKQELEQPRATLEMETTPVKVEITYRNPDFRVDQSRAWDALGLGGILETMKRIREEARNVALQGIARIVENGNRMAAIHREKNAIADIAREQSFAFHEFNYLGPASYDNVDVYITTYPPVIEFHGGGLEINVQVNPPVHRYHRGKLDIYMMQYPKVDIIPPQIDLRL